MQTWSLYDLDGKKYILEMVVMNVSTWLNFFYITIGSLWFFIIEFFLKTLSLTFESDPCDLLIICLFSLPWSFFPLIVNYNIGCKPIVFNHGYPNTIIVILTLLLIWHSSGAPIREVIHVHNKVEIGWSHKILHGMDIRGGEQLETR